LKKMLSVRMTQWHVSFNRQTTVFAREATVNVPRGVYCHDPTVYPAGSWYIYIQLPLDSYPLSVVYTAAVIGFLMTPGREILPKQYRDRNSERLLREEA